MREFQTAKPSSGADVIRFAALALAAALASGLSGGRVAPIGDTAFAPERLARFNRALQQYVDDERTAGLVGLVLRDGQIVYERAIGWADKENRRPMRVDTIFRIASQTKAMTSAAALVLIEEGRLKLADPVSRYLPSFHHTTVAVVADEGMTIVPARRPITVHDLLTHTSGISYGSNRVIADRYVRASLGPVTGFAWYTADKDEPICTTMDRLGTLPFVAQPGDAWVYGYSLDVLGCVLERASGMLLDEVLRTRITDPLKMEDTHFFLPAGQRDRLAVVYTGDGDGRIVRAPEGATGQGHYVDGPRRSFAGGAGLLSTVHDYARFLEMIRRDGELDGVRVLSPASARAMHTNAVGMLHVPAGRGFGLGFETTERFGATSLACVGSYGWGGAYGTAYLVDPENRLTMLMMQQVVPEVRDPRQAFQVLVYQAFGVPQTDRCMNGSSGAS